MLPSTFNHPRFDYLASYNDKITTSFSFWKMSSLDGSFLQVTNNQTKNNGGGEGGGAPSSPRAKGTAVVALHVKFSKCRSAPIMQGFRSAFKFAELRRRDLQSLSSEQRAHLPLPLLLLSVCGFKVRHFHLNWRELDSIGATARDQR